MGSKRGIWGQRVGRKRGVDRNRREVAEGDGERGVDMKGERDEEGERKVAGRQITEKEQNRERRERR